MHDTVTKMDEKPAEKMSSRISTSIKGSSAQVNNLLAVPIARATKSTASLREAK
jgi:hypothetical protein